MNILRDVAGGFGRLHSSSQRTNFGQDTHAEFNPPAMEAHACGFGESLGFEVGIIDGQGENLSLKGLIDRIETLGPRFILSRPSLPSFSWDMIALSFLKKEFPELNLIAWGTVPRYMPHRVLKESSIDMVSMINLKNTIENISANKGKSCLAKRKKKLIISPEKVSRSLRPLDLDSMPTPAYHLLDFGLYKSNSRTYFPVYGSIGCSFSCYYCPYPVGFGSPWRGRDPIKVTEEINRLVEDHGIERIWFRDQTWNMKPKRSIRLCELIKNLESGIDWYAALRADKLGLELAKWMKSSGCFRVEMGLETGDQRQFAALGKKSSSLKRVENGFLNAKQAGLLSMAHVMVGLPGDGWSQTRNTMMFLDRISPENLQVSIATPYPGTPFYTEAVRKGWFVDNCIEHLDGKTPVLSYPGFSRMDIIRARKALLDWRRGDLFIRDFKRDISNGNYYETMHDVIKMTLKPIPILRRILNIA